MNQRQVFVHYKYAYEQRLFRYSIFQSGQHIIIKNLLLSVNVIVTVIHSRQYGIAGKTKQVLLLTKSGVHEIEACGIKLLDARGLRRIIWH